jgi:hypothetical protein
VLLGAEFAPEQKEPSKQSHAQKAEYSDGSRSKITGKRPNNMKWFRANVQ